MRTMQFISVAAAISLAACASVPVDRYQALASTSQSIQENSDQVFSEIESQQRDFSIFAAPNEDLAVDSFAPVLKINGKVIKNLDIKPYLDSRRAALETLVNYTKALDALAEKDYTSGVDSAAQGLAASLKSLPGGPEASTVVNVMASVVDILGHAATDRMKRNYLEEAMRRGQPGVDALAKLFQSDEAHIDRFVGEMRDRYLDHAKLARPGYATWQRYKFDEEVATQLEAYAGVLNSLHSMDLTISKVPLAHQELLNNLRKNESKTEELTNMIQALKTTHAFYQGIQK